MHTGTVYSYHRLVQLHTEATEFKQTHPIDETLINHLHTISPMVYFGDLGFLLTKKMNGANENYNII